MEGKQINFIKEYFGSIKVYLLFTSALFVGVMIFGYIIGDRSVYLWDFLKEMFGGYPSNPVKLFGIIFLNNSVKAFLAVILGIIFGVFPVFFVVLNSLIIGVAVFHLSGERGINFVLRGILPHGVIELPMILISSAIGIRIGLETFKKVFSGEGNIKREVKNGVKFYFFLVLPLLFVAALVESFLTPLFIS